MRPLPRGAIEAIEVPTNLEKKFASNFESSIVGGTMLVQVFHKSLGNGQCAAALYTNRSRTRLV